MIRFIRSIARIDLFESDSVFIQNIFKSAILNDQWINIQNLAQFNDLEPFLFYHINNFGITDKLPGKFIEPIKNSYIRIKQQTSEQIAAARELVYMGEQKGIPVMAIQGLSLKSTVYKNLDVRHLGDLDIMVRPKDREGFRGLVVDAGYSNKSPLFPDLFDRGFIQVDIHTHILNLDRIKTRRFIFPEDLTPMWNRAVKTETGLLMPDFFDNIIALSAHALKHCYSRLIWLTDIYECLLICSKEPKGWAVLIERAGFWGQKRILLYAVVLAERLLGARIPFWVKNELGLKDLNIMERHYLRLRTNGFAPRSLPHVLWLQSINSPGRKIKYLKEVIFPENNIREQILENPVHGDRRRFIAGRVLDVFNNIKMELQSVIESANR